MAIARGLGMERSVVTCREDNIASEKTIRKAGLSYEATVDVPENSYLWNNDIKRIKRFCMNFRRGKGEQAHAADGEDAAADAERSATNG